MQENQQKVINRVYISLDKPFNVCIINYNWSSTKLDWVLEKAIWNTGNETIVSNSLRDGKYNLVVF